MPGGKRTTKGINHHIKTWLVVINTAKREGLEKEREKMCAISDKVAKEGKEETTLNKAKNATMWTPVKSAVARWGMQRPRGAQRQAKRLEGS